MNTWNPILAVMPCHRVIVGGGRPDGTEGSADEVGFVDSRSNRCVVRIVFNFCQLPGHGKDHALTDIGDAICGAL